MGFRPSCKSLACLGIDERVLSNVVNEIIANRIQLSRASVPGCVGGRNGRPGYVAVDDKGGWARNGSRGSGGGGTVAVQVSSGRPTRGEGRPPGLRAPGLTTRPAGVVQSLARAGPGPCDDITPSKGTASRHGMPTRQGLLWPHYKRVTLILRIIFDPVITYRPLTDGEPPTPFEIIW